MRVHDSQAYRKMDVTTERIIRILELREILMSFQTGFNLIVSAAVVCAILKSISGLEPSSLTTEPRYWKLVTVSSYCPFTLISFAKQQQSKDTRFSSAEKRINTSMVLDSLFTRTS